MLKSTLFKIVERLKPIFMNQNMKYLKTKHVEIHWSYVIYKLAHNFFFFICNELFMNWEVLYNFNSFVVVNLVFRKLIFWLEGPKMPRVMEDFKQWCGLFNTQGFTNGTHVLISKPFIPYPQDYYYHKSKGYSMVAQVMVDSNKKFIDIFISLPRNVNNSQDLKFGLYQQAQYHVLFSKQRMWKWNFTLLIWGQRVLVY